MSDPTRALAAEFEFGYWRRQLVNRAVGPDLLWRDADVMVVVGKLVAAHDAEARTPAEPDGLNREVLWEVLAGIGVIDNGTWVRFERADMELIADAYRAALAEPQP